MTTPDTRRTTSADFRIVDLFAGPGGLDVAAAHLGIPVVAGIEIDKDARATRLAAGLATHDEGDVRNCGPEDFPGATVLTGGPPCQTYTVAGSGAGRQALDAVVSLAKRMAAREEGLAEDFAKFGDERIGLVLEPLRWALAAIDAGKPYEAIVLEQVQGAMPVWTVMGNVLSSEGYDVAPPVVLQTEEYGVPQTRRRAILVARWQGRAELPEPTHRPYRKGVDRSEGDSRKAPWVTMGDVLGDRPDSFYVVSNYGTGSDPKARGRRTSDMPSATVTGKISRNRLYLPDGEELSRLTNEEAGLLQTFPADYRWSGNGVAQQIGNAIPPRLGVHVLAAALGLGDTALKEGLASVDRSMGLM
ncbi:DNA cytosine methyltransferase [Streptomyces sp. NPDC020875]|uniref:DNA cytosine methyltransferase n=1 Tax=Streptomyces sp. NPDC020875 TaxID=3154898 RepID=UPI0033E9ED5E